MKRSSLYIWGTHTFEVHIHLRYTYIWGTHTFEVHIQLRYSYIWGTHTFEVHTHLKYTYIWGTHKFEVHIHLRYTYIWGTHTFEVHIHLKYTYIWGTQLHIYICAYVHYIYAYVCTRSPQTNNFCKCVWIRVSVVAHSSHNVYKFVWLWLNWKGLSVGWVCSSSGLERYPDRSAAATITAGQKRQGIWPVSSRQGDGGVHKGWFYKKCCGGVTMCFCILHNFVFTLLPLVYHTSAIWKVAYLTRPFKK